MNGFYELFFSLSIMSNNVPPTSNWFWLPAVGPTRSLHFNLPLNTRPVLKSKVNIWRWWSRSLLGNFRRRRKRLTGGSSQYFSPQSLFCLLTYVRPHHLTVGWSEAEPRRNILLPPLHHQLLITYFAPHRKLTEFNTKHGSAAIKRWLMHHGGLSFHLAQHQFPCLIRVALSPSSSSSSSAALAGNNWMFPQQSQSQSDSHNWTELAQ